MEELFTFVGEHRWLTLTASVALPVILLVIIKYFLAQGKNASTRQDNNGCVFITGCDSGIGLTVAKYWHSRNSCTVLAGVLNEASNGAKELTSLGVTCIQVDITKKDSVEKCTQLIEKACQNMGKELLAVMNNAGVLIMGDADWFTDQQIEQIVQVNVLGTMRMTRAVLPLLEKSKGRVIIVTSINGLLATPGTAVYSASKFALEAFSDSLRMEMKDKGVDVVKVRPGDFSCITNIVSENDRHLDRMLEEMSENRKELYRDKVGRYKQMFKNNRKRSEEETCDITPLLATFDQAVFSSRPKPAYMAADIVVTIVIWVLSHLPNVISDVICRRAMKYALYEYKR